MPGSLSHPSPCRGFSYVQLKFCRSCWKFQAGTCRRRRKTSWFLLGLVVLLLNCGGQPAPSFNGPAGQPAPSFDGPAGYFRSQKYFEGHIFEDLRYEHLDALHMKDKKTGIIMSSFAIDVRQNADQGGLRDGDQVLWHYTNHEAFQKITNLQKLQLKLLASRDSWKDVAFEPGCYATKFAPHECESKNHLLINNFLPEDTKIKKLRGETLREGETLEDLMGGEVEKYVVENHGDKADYCIPIIVDWQVAKNVMKEHTDAPAMPNGKKRQAGFNRHGQKEPGWRDVWVISVYKKNQENGLEVTNAEQSTEAIKAIFLKRIENSKRTVRELQAVVHDDSMPNVFRICLQACWRAMISLLALSIPGFLLGSIVGKPIFVKLIELDNSCARAYNKLGLLLKPGEEIQVQLRYGPRIFGKKQLFLKAIELDNSDAAAYYNLGTVLKPGEEIHIKLRDGPRIFGEKQLYLKAIELDNDCPVAYRTLAIQLQLEGIEKIEVQLRDGPRTFSRVQLCATWIELISHWMFWIDFFLPSFFKPSEKTSFSEVLSHARSILRSGSDQ